MYTIRRIDFISKVVSNYERNSYRENWTVEDSFILVAENVDLGDMNKEQYDRLMNDCKYNVNKSLICGE